jgi:predicted NAD/FAD-dependent oxidoreductase
MRVGIVGAGISGLAAARDLQQRGAKVVVFEKSRGPGGRCSTRRANGFIWDTGATSIAPRGKAIERVILDELATDELIQVEKPIYLHRNLIPNAGDPSRTVPRYTYRNGMNTLPKLLSTGIEIRTEVEIERISRAGEGYRIGGTHFDAVVLTAPIPQTAALLWTLDESRPIASARYRSNLCIALGYDTPLPETPYFAILDPSQVHPMTWMSIESVKAPERAPAVVVQMSRQYSFDHYADSPNELIVDISRYVEALFGSTYRVPAAADVMKWKYAQPDTTADFDTVNPPGSRLVIAGDGVSAGRLEEAFDSGLRASQLLC